MTKNEYLSIVRKHIHFIFDRDAISEELNDHICSCIEDLMADGLSREKAERLAIEQMGSPVELGKMLNQEHHPFLGYVWVVSNAVLVFLLIPTITLLLSFGHGFIKMATPAVIDNCVEKFAVNYEVEIPTHRIVIDNLCIDEENQYYLTYRSWTNWDYSRAGWNSNGIQVIDDYGLVSGGAGFSSSSFLGSYGYTRFDMPEDGIINVSFRDGKTIELDMGAYQR